MSISPRQADLELQRVNMERVSRGVGRQCLDYDAPDMDDQVSIAGMLP